MGKKTSPVRKIFLCETGQPMPTSWRRGTKEHLFYRISPSVCFWILRLFSFRIVESRRTFEEEENEFLQRDIKENSNNLVQNQEQVTVSSTASVMKTSTSLRAVPVKVKYRTKAAAVAGENESTMRSLN